MGLAVAVVWLAACQTPGYWRSDVAAQKVRAAAQAVWVAGTELEASLGALNELAHQPATDLKLPFGRSQTALDRWALAARQAQRSTAEVWQPRAADFRVWDREIAAVTDPAICRRSEARKVEVHEQFKAANRKYETAQEDLDSLIC